MLANLSSYYNGFAVRTPSIIFLLSGGLNCFPFYFLRNSNLSSESIAVLCSFLSFFTTIVFVYVCGVYSNNGISEDEKDGRCNAAEFDTFNFLSREFE